MDSIGLGISTFGSSLWDDIWALATSSEMVKLCSDYGGSSKQFDDFNLFPLAKSFWYGELSENLDLSFSKTSFCLNLVFRFFVCSFIKSLISYSASSGSDT